MFIVYSENNYYNCFSQKKVKNSKVLVGDNVEFCLDEKTGEYVITKVGERLNEIIRPFVSNITQLFIVLSCVPEPDLILIDKLIINAKMNKIKPILLVNKCDLDKTLFNKIKEEYKDSKIEIIDVSSKTKQNFDIIKSLLKNNITCLAGQSAVGKTSIINSLLGLQNKVNSVSEKIMRGKNTTTSAELIKIDDDSFILDTAGFTKIEFMGFNPDLIKDYYEEFKNNACDFANCTHIYEGKKCSIIGNNNINQNRYERYKQIYLESKDNWSKRYD